MQEFILLPIVAISLASRNSLVSIAKEQIKDDKFGIPEVRVFMLHPEYGPRYIAFKLPNFRKFPLPKDSEKLARVKKGILMGF